MSLCKCCKSDNSVKNGMVYGKPRYNIDISASDYYAVYGQYKISKRHIMTKKETALVESKNSLIRHYLARFNIKTKR